MNDCDQNCRECPDWNWNTGRCENREGEERLKEAAAERKGDLARDEGGTA